MRFAKVAIVASQSQITMVTERRSVTSNIGQRSVWELRSELCGRNPKWILESEQKVAIVSVDHSIASPRAETDRSIRTEDVPLLILNHKQALASVIHNRVERFRSQSVPSSGIEKAPLRFHI